jgi:hypothetical protein
MADKTNPLGVFMSRKFIVSALVAAFVATLCAACGQSLKGEIAITNETGETITEINISHANAEDFDEENLLKAPLASGDTFKLAKSVFKKAGAYDFNFYSEASDSDYNLWDVNVKGMNAVSVTTDDKYMPEMSADDSSDQEGDAASE